MKTTFTILLFYVLNSFMTYSQSYNEHDVEGIYYGKMRMGGSISGQDISLRFYPDGEVIGVLIPRRPSYVDNFAKTFDRKSKGRYSSGTYKLEKGKITFQLKLVQNGNKYTFKFNGKLSFSKTIKVILFSITNKTNNMGYRLYSERLWSPKEKRKGKKIEEELLVDANDDVPSIAENNKNINNQVKLLDDNLKKDNLEAAAGNLNNIGLSHFNNKDYEDAVTSFNEALVLSEMTGDKKAVANIHNNLGVSHERLNQKKAAIRHFEQAKDNFDAIGDKESAAKVVYQISLLERNHLNRSGERDALKRLIEIEKKNESKEELSASYNNIAISLIGLKDIQGASDYLNKAYELDQKNEFKEFIGVTINNRGNIEFENGNVQEAINSYKQALEIKSKNNDKRSQAITLHNLGNALYSVGDLDKAEEYIRKSLLMSKEAKDAKTMNANYRALANLLADGNQCTDPLENYKNYISMRFSVVESEVIKPLYEDKQKYLDSEFRSDQSISDDVKKLGIGNDDFISINMLQEDLRAAQKAAEQEIKEAEGRILLLNKSNALLESQNEVMEAKSKTLSWIVAGGSFSGLLVLALLMLALRAKNRAKKDNLKIEEQKELIEEKNKGFMDSVTYASRLQTAILPPDNLLAEQLKEFFVLYKPKDIVAGDFYWTETVGQYTYVAAADCTGHGVPGAMVSVVCSNSLFRAVNEFGLRDTGEILDKVRELVIQTFEKSVEEVKDGMDISMVRLEKNSDKIQYTGANNSLIIIRARKEGQEFQENTVYNDYKYLEEFKADKQPVGQWQYAKRFTTNTIGVEEGDQLFLFSDGYADQFGGVKGKKMKVKTLKELFLEVSTLSLADQKQKLDDSFNEWKRDFEQIDDVCVMGVKV